MDIRSYFSRSAPSSSNDKDSQKSTPEKPSRKRLRRLNNEASPAAPKSSSSPSTGSNKRPRTSSSPKSKPKGRSARRIIDDDDDDDEDNDEEEKGDVGVSDGAEESARTKESEPSSSSSPSAAAKSSSVDSTSKSAKKSDGKKSATVAPTQKKKQKPPSDFFSPRPSKPKKSQSSQTNGTKSSSSSSSTSDKSANNKKEAASAASATSSSSSSSIAKESVSNMDIDEDESNMKSNGDDDESDVDSDASDMFSDKDDDEDDLMVDEDEDKPKKSKKKDVEYKPPADLKRNRLKKNYDVVEDAGWKAGEPVPFLELARSFAQIEDISGRLKTIEVMANLFRSVIALTPQELLPVIYLCTNKIAPPYENLELGVGDSLLFKALQQSTGRKLSQLRLDAEETGDLGIIAERSRGQQMLMFRPKPLTVNHVFKAFKDLSQTEGNKSRDKKVGMINKLFVASREAEARYIVRALQGKMRIGFSEQSVLVALARACALTPPAQDEKDVSKMVLDTRLKGGFQKRMTECETIIKEVYSEVPNWDMVIPALIENGIDELPTKCFLTPGVPIKAMLAKPTKGISEILERFAKLLFTLEFKYDGERIQIHLLANGEFAFFSRNAESSTAKFPDIQKDLKNHFDNSKINSFIIDCEVVAYDIKEKKILPFQTLSTRKRKDVKTEDISVQVCLYAFDCLYLNGESLLKKPFQDRRTVLHDTFNAHEGKFMFAEHRDTADVEEIQTFLDLAITSSCEGLMVKTLQDEATYEPSKRSRSWLKVKKDYLAGVGDTFDLVPIGAYHGRGKRTGVFGAYLVACYDTESEEYQAICKIGTGLSDEFLASSTKFFVEGKHLIPKPPRYYKLPTSEIDDPHVWFEPSAVWEIKCADLSVSPKYFAAVGHVHETKGIALRFPRFMRIRDDKQPDQATSAEQVADMYRNQSVVSSGSGRGGPPRR